MYPRLLLLGTGLAAFLGGLVLFAPLSRMAALLPEVSPMRSATFEGTFIEGRVTLLSGAGQTIWHFRLQPLYFLTLGLGGDWKAEGAGIGAEGVAVLRPWGLSARVLSGKVSGARLAQLAGGDAFQTDEPLFLKDVEFNARPGTGLVAADGQLSWGPGSVQLRERAHPVSVPPLVGRLSTSDGVIHLLVGDAGAPDVALLEATLTPADRQLHVVVPGRAMKALGLSSKFADDKPAFEMKQSL